MMTPKQEAEQIMYVICKNDTTINNAIAIVDKIIEALEHNEWQNKEYIQHYYKVKDEMFKL